MAMESRLGAFRRQRGGVGPMVGSGDVPLDPWTEPNRHGQWRPEGGPGRCPDPRGLRGGAQLAGGQEAGGFLPLEGAISTAPAAHGAR